MTRVVLPKIMSTRVAVVVVTLLLAWFGPHAAAQSCKDLPRGPEKMQCWKQKHPDAAANKMQHCLDVAVQRDSATDKGTKKEFMHDCMRGKVGG